MLVAGLAGASPDTTAAAVPLFASASSTATSVPAQTLAIARPAGAGPGHVLVAAVAVRDQVSLSAPSGWTEAVKTTCSGSGVDVTQAVFVRAAAVGEPGFYTFSTGAATGAVGSIVAYTGVDAAQPVDASAGQIRRNSALIIGPSVTTTVAGALVVGVFTHNLRSATTVPGGMTARGGAATGTAAPSARMLVSDELRAATGPTGERRADVAQKYVCGVGQLVALRPAPDPPASTSAPTVSGVAQEGRVLSATAGSWSPSPTSFAFQWQRSPGGSAWSDIAGASSSGYTATAADVGFTLRVVVTATNNGGFGTAASAPTAVVLPRAPANVSAPTISGVARVHQTLTAEPGSWSGSPTAYSYGWERSDDGGATWLPVAGAGSTAHVLTAAEVGTVIRVVVTASNPGGTGTASSSATAPVLPALPSSIDPPTISGDPRQGATLTAAPGSWSGSPTGLTYQWQRSAGGSQSWSEIAGASAATYTLAAADVGSVVRVVVTATNASGSTSAASAATAPVVAAFPPGNVVPPAILGTPHEGAPLSATTGVWTGAPYSYAYRWRRSADNGATWADIAGAVGAVYTPAAGDVGLRLAVTVTATNANGSSSASSPASAPVQSPGLAPANSIPPAVSGAAVEGATLFASTGAWVGNPIDYAYEWQRCDAAGCIAIRFAVDPDYTLRDDDVGFTIKAVVTASNLSGSASATSAPTVLVLPLAPVNEEPPVIALGVPSQGETLTTSTGDWLSSAPVTYAYQWQSSVAGGATWVDIPGAQADSYRLVAGDVGLTVRVVVTASNAGGSAGAPSAATAVVTPPGPPINVVAPSISGVVQQGGRLDTTPGTWSGSPTYSYVWQRSSNNGVTWSNIGGARSAGYTLAAANVGRLVRMVVTARNAYGTRTAESSAWEIFPAGNGQFILVNSTWYCNGPVDVELVKVTITNAGNLDAIRFDSCSGRIGRVEVETNGLDGLKVRNLEPVAHDLTIEGGWVRCTGRPESAHQDGIQAIGGSRVTFRNLVIWCGTPEPDWGAGVNASALFGKAGAGPDPPTDIVIEHSVMGPGTANGVLISESVRSGIRGSVACPDFTTAGGPVTLGEASIDGIDVDNEKPTLDDPRCWSFEAALSWAES